MGLSYEDLKPERDKAKTDVDARKNWELEQNKFAGGKISQLMADPNWGIYARYVQREIDKHTMSAKAQEAKLLDVINPLPPQEDIKAKLQLAHNKACLEAHGFDLEYVKVLITKGEEAAKELEQSKTS